MRDLAKAALRDAVIRRFVEAFLAGDYGYHELQIRLETHRQRQLAPPAVREAAAAAAIEEAA
jgi:hypothetical protein